jgi:uncharacterized protein
MLNNFVILEGKNLNDLIEDGLKKLGVNKNQINVEVLESKKNLFGSHFKIKVSLKETENVARIEKSLTEIYNNSLTTNNIDNQKTMEFIYKEDGVYISINKNITLEDIKAKVEIKRIWRRHMMPYKKTNLMMQSR